MRRTKLTLALTGLTVGALGLGLSACAKWTEPFNDAPVASKDDTGAEVYSMPDGFSNVATKCDKHGNRIYVVYHSNNAYGSVAVVAQDPSCGGAK